MRRLAHKTCSSKGAVDTPMCRTARKVRTPNAVINKTRENKNSTSACACACLGRAGQGRAGQRQAGVGVGLGANTKLCQTLLPKWKMPWAGQGQGRQGWGQAWGRGGQIQKRSSQTRTPKSKMPGWAGKEQGRVGKSRYLQNRKCPVGQGRSRAG